MLRSHRNRRAGSVRAALAAAGLVILLVLGMAGTASAQTDTYPPPSPPVSVERAREAAPPVEVQAARLAFTGSDVVGLAVIGASLAGLGWFLVSWSRRATAPESA